MGRFSKVISAFAFLLLLAGCSDGQHEPLRHSVSRDELVRRYVLLNEYRQTRPPGHAAGAAMGMFLKAPEVGERGECVATHIAHGLLMTNAHCAIAVPAIAITDYFVIYFSRKTGLLTHGNVSALIKIGNDRLDDVAFFRLPKEVADDWADLRITRDSGYLKHELLPQENNPANLGAEIPLVEKVLVPGFDPLKTRPDFNSAFRGRVGAMFSLKTCYMSRTVPWQAYANADGSPGDIGKFQPSNKTLHPEVHLFFDRCDVTTRAGNSGSPVFTEGGDLAGIFHWNMAKHDFQNGQMYLGSDRKWFNVWGDFASLAPETAIFNVGTDFHYLVNRRYPVIKTEIPPT